MFSKLTVIPGMNNISVPLPYMDEDIQLAENILYLYLKKILACVINHNPEGLISSFVFKYLKIPNNCRVSSCLHFMLLAMAV